MTLKSCLSETVLFPKADCTADPVANTACCWLYASTTVCLAHGQVVPSSSYIVLWDDATVNSIRESAERVDQVSGLSKHR
mmetsp:Transcript_35069/g.69317  ORF Transcript_35069/g.69317 Transcript_35069/m.69317 type:complete len:80 (+) Transcript_35069:1654-1893(+)